MGRLEGLQMRPSRWKHMERLRQAVANTGQKVGSRKVPGYGVIIDIVILLVIANTSLKAPTTARTASQRRGAGWGR